MFFGLYIDYDFKIVKYCDYIGVALFFFFIFWRNLGFFCSDTT